MPESGRMSVVTTLGTPMPVSARTTTIKHALNGIELKKFPNMPWVNVPWVRCPVLPLPGPIHGSAGVPFRHRLASGTLGPTRSSARATIPALVVITM